MPSFNENNLGHTLLVSMDKRERTCIVYDEEKITLENGIEMKIWEMDDKYIYHNSNLTFQKFPISCYDVSKYNMLFLRNSLENNKDLQIDGKLYSRPDIYVVTRVDDASSNTFVKFFSKRCEEEHLLFSQHDSLRIFLHKLNEDYKGIENCFDLLNFIKDFLIPK